MKYLVTRCDFCGREERTATVSLPLANSQPPQDQWRSVKSINDQKECGAIEEHMCPDCYKKAKAFGKQALTLTMPKEGAK